ncbi:hypothetical protein G9C98_008440 [Cotesia typhae]|uniref:Prefoldin subunit 5 n=1 Tax=Cotesia typhae TaxID=2053667 RepID=A0A8J5R0D5_9HYME|nr:hypothetical protein G9C98_008440 [Cotesia typhae]
MSTISASEAPHLQQIDLTKLSLQQLTLLKQQLDKELNVFQDSLQTLKIAQSKFQESGFCLDKVTPEAKVDVGSSLGMRRFIYLLGILLAKSKLCWLIGVI